MGWFNISLVVPEHSGLLWHMQSLVTELQRRMESSVVPQSPPNPSILIALNLVGTQDGTKEKLLVQQIKDRVIKEGTAEMTSGEVALYVLALLSSCEDPKPSPSLPPAAYLYPHYPAVLLTAPPCQLHGAMLWRMCCSNHPYTGAMATLALTCVQNAELESIHKALDKLRKQILRAVETNTANIYSIGLALQALNVTPVSYPSEDWSCSQTLAKVLTEISQGAFDNPMAAAQILPSLVGKTYLNVIRLSCLTGKGKDRSVVSSPTSHFPIMVEYTITNHLRGQYFNYTIRVSVPKGSVLLSVLQAAQQNNPQDFSYETKQTSWGLMVVSINNRAANSNDKTYWQFFNGTKPLEQGADYVPSNNEHIKANFSTY
uniref:Cobalamin binding intrinsic factor n=1 Tax=Chrysemys picta bellii TaxID=8478 RepID=A0A8C3FQN8_CHRPI